MREVLSPQLQLGELAIGSIPLNTKSRDDIPRLLLALQFLFNEKRDELFALLSQGIAPEKNHATGRPGMSLWRILVLGVLKQGLDGCDFDRLQTIADEMTNVRLMLGHDQFTDNTRYDMQTLVSNVALLTPELLQSINQLVIEEGHSLVGKEPGDALRGRCDSFVVETDVHFPTDVWLLWDAMRCLIREVNRTAKAHQLSGWRQWKKLTERVRKQYNQVSTRGRQSEKRIKAYLELCGELMARVDHTLLELKEKYGEAKTPVRPVKGSLLFYRVYAEKFIDQIDRRLLKKEKIPQEEKVFSIFEEHTRWCAKGKAGKPVELGVPVCLVTDQHQFILHHKVMFEGQDVDIAVPIIKETQEQHPDLRVCSFDRGFHSQKNRKQLDESLEVNALPGKGRLSKADRERESEEEFVEARRQHPAVESAINALDHRGLDRVRTHSAEGFARTVALSIVASNIHQLGRLLQRRRHRRQHLRPAA